MRPGPTLHDKKKQHKKRLLNLPGVTAVAVGAKEKGGKKTGAAAIVVYVKKKVAAKDLPAGQNITEIVTDAPVDVKEAGEIRALDQWVASGVVSLERTARERPVLGASSEGHVNITAGTGSVLVRDMRATAREEAQQTARLSNNHVYANSNAAQPGDPILQPGRHDGGSNPADKVGELIRFVPIRFDGSANLVDAAIRTVQPDEEQYGDLGSPGHITEFEVGQRVVKEGRTTDRTFGDVDAIDASVRVGYGGGKEALFEDQIFVNTECPPFSQGGDSGSAVFDLGMNWGGLLFAGNQDGSLTVISKASWVESELNVQLVSGHGTDVPDQPCDEGPGFPGGCNPFRSILGLFR